MGCGQSMIEMDESVMRCKERKGFIQDAVAARNAFAAAHAAYGVALKHAGGALYDYAQSDLLLLHDSVSGGHPHHHHRSAAIPAASSVAASSSSAAPAPVVAPPIDKFPPPPPPLPDLSPPLQRSVSMPEIAIPKPKKKMPPAEASIREEDAFEKDDGEEQEEGPVTDEPTPADDDHRRSSGASSSFPPDAGGPWDYFGFNAETPPPTLSQPEEQPSWNQQEVRSTKKAAAAQPTTSFVEEVLPKAEPSRPPKPLKKSKPPGGSLHHQHAAPAGGVPDTKKGKMVATALPSMGLMQVVDELYEHFLSASRSTHDVGKMLEATRLHYHSNFADNRGHIDHSARVMRVITWNRSIKGMPQTNEGSDDFEDEEWETHATILDKMLAWEKKLYDEVKVGEVMKIEYQSKIARLNNLKRRGARPEAVEKAQSVVNHFHTRYIVDMQSMDSMVSEIKRLRDHQLYPKLVALVDGMAKMWEIMHDEHLAQYNIINSLKVPDSTFAPRETSDHHYRAGQLWKMVKEWHSHFDELVNHQKDYIKDLNSWLKLNLIPIESSLKEKVSSPQREPEPPIKSLLSVWQDELEKLPIDHPKNTITTFSGRIHAILMHQEEELKLKDKCESLRREFERKQRAFDHWHQKYMEKTATLAEVGVNPGGGGGEGSIQDPVAERKAALEELEKNLEKEDEDYRKLCKTVREKSLGSLRTELPKLFEAMFEFSLRCSQMYKKLLSVTTPQSSSTA